jgi:hypothetical protein
MGAIQGTASGKPPWSSRTDANARIRVIVKNGRAVIKDMVDNEADKNIKGIRANTVADVFRSPTMLRVQIKAN